MHVDLLATTKGSPKIVHGTENGKKTACGINLVKPENIGKFTNAGAMSDVVQLTCEKCKTVIAKRMIREANKEFAAQIKEEQRQLKRERAASKHSHEAAVVPPPPVSAPSASSGSGSSSGGGYIPPSMRKAMQTQQQPIDTPTPAPAAPTPAPTPVQSAPQDVLSQFAVPTVPSSLPRTAPPPPAPVSAPSPVVQNTEDVLAQFAVPSVPTSLPQMAPPPPVPVTPSAPIAQSADDVLAQFAVPSVPTSLPQMAPPPPVSVTPSAPIAQSADDVLAQFAVPSVPTSLPQMAPPPPVSAAPSAPIAQSADDVLAQFAIPSVPTSIPQTPPPAPVSVPELSAPVVSEAAPIVDSVDDVLAQFTVPTAPTAAHVSESAHVSGSSVNQSDILAQYALKQPGTHPYPADDIPDAGSDPLADLLLMPKGQEAQSSTDALSEMFNVPTTPAAMQQTAIPSLNVPQAPPAPPAPAMPVPPAQQGFAVPVLPQAQTVPQNYGQAPSQQEFNPFAVPSAPKKSEPGTPMPLFVGYSADGRQLFQNYDALGNPIPINEPVYSAPPEQKDHNIAAQVAAMASNAALHGNAPIMDMDEILASMGIADPSKKKKDEGKAINYTEYKIPEKKKKKPAASRPASAVAAPVPEGPVSAAEAKRRKKVDKINKEFEKQLRSRGIDPKTGGIILDNRK